MNWWTRMIHGSSDSHFHQTFSLLSPFFLLGELPPLSVQVFLALVWSALLFPSLWLVPPLSVLNKNMQKKKEKQWLSIKTKLVKKKKYYACRCRYDSFCKVCISHLFLQEGGFPHSLSSFFLSLSQLLFLSSPLLLYETLSLGLLFCSLLCLPALQLFTTPPGHVINFNTTVVMACHCSVSVSKEDTLVTFQSPLFAGAPAPLSPAVDGPLSSFQPGDARPPLGL